MKKIITTLFLSIVIGNLAFSQYFQGSFTNIGNRVTVKIKPTGNITDVITSIDFFIRYNIASTPAFTIANITANTTTFPGLNFTLGDGFNDVTYQYREFLFTSTIPQNTYTSGVEYDLVSFSLQGADAVATLELASDFGVGTYYFAITGTSGSLFDAGAGDQFYGPGFTKTGTVNILPLANVPVPVKFLGFDVAKKNNSAVLNWSVENESALTDKYIVESGVNGIDFPTVVATIAASSNGRGSNTYSFTQDNLSAVKSSGVIYYRIKQIDKDGKFVYTPIKNVRLDGKAFAVNAYPNPVKNNTKLTIDLLNESKIIISVTDGGGKQVKTMQIQGFKGPNIKDLNLSNLSSGNYMMKVQAGSEVKSIPLVKVD
jgi:hypothetical protein